MNSAILLEVYGPYPREGFTYTALIEMALGSEARLDRQSLIKLSILAGSAMATRRRLVVATGACLISSALLASLVATAKIPREVGYASGLLALLALAFTAIRQREERPAEEIVYHLLFCLYFLREGKAQADPRSGIRWALFHLHAAESYARNRLPSRLAATSPTVVEAAYQCGSKVADRLARLQTDLLYLRKRARERAIREIVDFMDLFLQGRYGELGERNVGEPPASRRQALAGRIRLSVLGLFLSGGFWGFSYYETLRDAAHPATASAGGYSVACAFAGTLLALYSLANLLFPAEIPELIERVKTVASIGKELR